MKKKNISFIEKMDKIISGGISKQLISFFIFTGIVVLGFMLISFLFGEDVTFYGEKEIYGNVRFERLSGLLYHFMDPSSLAKTAGNGIVVQVFVFLFTFAGMVLLGGLLITTLTNIVDRRVSDIEEGKVVYPSMKGHYVIIGYGDVTINIIRTLFEITGGRDVEDEDSKSGKEEGLSPILILTSQDVKQVRAQLFAQLPERYEKLIYFYSGNIDSYEHIKSLNIHSAKEVFVLGEKSEYGRDSKNLECVKTIAKLRGTGKELLTVNVQFDKLTSYSTIQKISLSDEFRASGGERSIYFRPFNFYENWARLLWGFNGSLIHKYDRLDYREMEEDMYVHLVIVGFNSMGRALLLEALRQCHYPNFVEGGKNGKKEVKTRITVVDKEMKDMLPEFLAQYPYLGQIKDIEIKYVNGKIQDPKVRNLMIEETENWNALLTVAICLEDPDLSLSTGLCLPDKVFYKIEDNKIQHTDTRVLIRQALVQEGIGQLLESDNDKYSKVHIFGMTDKGVCRELMNDDFAMYVNAYYTILYYDRSKPDNKHDIIEAYDKYVKKETDINPELAGNSFIDWVIMPEHKEFMHETAKQLWLFLNEDMRFANRYQIDMFGTYAKYINSPMLMQMEHLRWNADRSIVGYLSSADSGIKDTSYKLHKSIIPFNALSEKEQKKDEDVIENMKKLMSTLPTPSKS